MTASTPPVAIIMGSQSDWPTMREAAAILDELGIGYEARIVSAHRTPDRLWDYGKTAVARGLRVIIADGAQVMLEDGKKFDCILVDGFDKHGRAGVLDTLPFYQACRNRLSDTGLLVTNLLGHSRGFQASQARIAKAFDGRSLVFPSCDSGNTIAFATAGDEVDVALDDLIAAAKAAPGELAYASSGTATPGHLAAEIGRAHV